MPLLEIKNLKKSYVAPDGTRQTIVNVPHFALEAGEQMALMGESGTGKTTFLNLIAGILKADSGTIALDGKEITTLSEAERDRLRAGKIGYIFQTFNLLQGFTALENVRLGTAFGANRADAQRPLDLLTRVGLADRAEYLPRQLSVGQQQRVAVARALASRPKIVLADEPTGNLDRRRAFEALDLIREICLEANAALLLVSHDREILSKFARTENLMAINQTEANLSLQDSEKL